MDPKNGSQVSPSDKRDHKSSAEYWLESLWSYCRYYYVSLTFRKIYHNRLSWLWHSRVCDKVLGLLKTPNFFLSVCRGHQLNISNLYILIIHFGISVKVLFFICTIDEVISPAFSSIFPHENSNGNWFTLDGFFTEGLPTQNFSFLGRFTRFHSSSTYGGK
jgi:hypothetical protein